jgi:arginine decarboxylase
LRTGEPYYLGFFLMGAYQATMGDIHNLFGRVNEVHVFEDADEPGGYYLEEVVHGQTVKDVLTSVQYLDAELIKMMKDQIDALVKAGTIKPREGVELLDQYEAVMGHYTYIDRNAMRVAEEVPPAAEKEKPVPAPVLAPAPGLVKPA